MSRVRAHVFISGYVQGVNFRASTRREAAARGITGWVANLPDGRVEAVFEGEASDVQNMVEWCRHGPPMADVRAVDVRWEPYTGEFRGFEVMLGSHW